MRIEDRIYTGLKQCPFIMHALRTYRMRIEDRIYTGLKHSIHAEYLEIINKNR